MLRSATLFCPVTYTILLAVFSASADANGGYEAPITVERVVETIVLNEDGSYRDTQEWGLRIETSEAISPMGAQRFSYSSSRDTVDSIDAWLIQPDGSKIVVPPDSIRTQEEGTGGGSSEFSDTKIKAIVYPQVRVGSRLFMKAVTTTHTPIFPGEFFSNYEMTAEFAIEHWELNVVAPKRKTLYVEQRGVDGGLIESSDDTNHYRFIYRRATAVAPDQIAVDSHDYSDILRISTLADPVAFGRLYQSAAAPKAIVSERIRAKALSLTAGLSGDRVRAQALYDWVTHDIRYVGVWLGSGGYIPHSADEVLTKEYGDCKDHVTLLGALLEAVGIPSSPAMVNSGSSYTLAAVGLSTNHVITYLPTLDLYVDSTDQFAPFGVLPFSDSDKPTILTALDRTGRTPPMSAPTNATHSVVSMIVHSDGSIDGTSRATLSGTYEIGARTARFGDRSTPEEQLVKNELSRFGETGSGTTKHADPQDIDVPYWVEGNFRLDPASNMPGQGALKVPVGLAPGSLASIARDKPPERQQHAYPCTSRTITENYRIEFPSIVSLSGLPKGTSYQDGPIRYQSTYTRAGRKVSIERSLVVQRGSQVCSPGDMQRWRAFHQQLQRDLRSQILYR